MLSKYHDFLMSYPIGYSKKFMNILKSSTKLLWNYRFLSPQFYEKVINVFLIIFHLIRYQVVVLLISKFQQRNKILTKVIKYIHTVVFRMAFTFGASTSKPSFGSFGTTAKTTESNVFGGFSTTTTTSSSGNRRLCFYFTQYSK